MSLEDVALSDEPPGSNMPTTIESNRRKAMGFCRNMTEIVIILHILTMKCDGNYADIVNRPVPQDSNSFRAFEILPPTQGLEQ